MSTAIERVEALAALHSSDATFTVDRPLLGELLRLAKLGARVEQCEERGAVPDRTYVEAGPATFVRAVDLLAWIREGRT